MCIIKKKETDEEEEDDEQTGTNLDTTGKVTVKS